MWSKFKQSVLGVKWHGSDLTADGLEKIIGEEPIRTRRRRE